MSAFSQYLASGLTIGAIFALVALGFTLIYNASHVVNFAQGEFVMIGGMATVFLAKAGLPVAVAACVAIAAAILVGLLLYALVIAPARGADAVVLIILTIGASLAIRGAAPIVFDKQIHKLPGFAGDAPIAFAGAQIQPQSLFIFGGMIAVVLALAVFLTRTRFGKAVVATAADPVAARLVGVNTGAVVAFSFGMSAGVGALAGVLVTPLALTSYDVGVMLALKGFAAAVLGGMGNPVGAVVGGLIVGLIESFAAGYVSSSYKDAAAFIIIVLMPLVRPGGLFGAADVERV